ncbi:lipase maturation factor family protein [Mycobacterium sp. SMC-16]|uniref:lipase maturation factor family protein n=1 Tax=Mycobacterium sp. SMC-16 TaxID=3385967 RepID=UPI00390C68A4
MDWFTAPEYWFSRLVLERGIAGVYLIAFLCAARQFRALLGAQGMLPIPRYLSAVSFRQAPSIFHWHYSDRFFAAVAWSGAALSTALVAGAGDLVPLWAAMLVWLLLWMLYLSIVNVGQRWYAFGWESLLLEAGFLAVFLSNDSVAPPVLVIWLARWLVFRTEFGAGLIKLRGDRCWRDLTCLYYHHETQPMPGPLSWFFHHLPKPLHRVEVAVNHVTQLVVPFGLFAPQPIATVAGAIVVVTQLWLVISGNYAWLSWLTMVLAFSAIAGPLPTATLAAPPAWFVVLIIGFSVLVVVLSYWPVRNLLSPQQRMNASFDPLHLVNTYGAFGSIGRIRREVVIEGTADAEITDETVWQEYEFKGKPGAVGKLPRQWAPYHLRLDWMMWFAAISPTYGRQWFAGLLERLLRGDTATLKLLRHNPFPESPPIYVRAQMFRYRYSTPSELRHDRVWWHRAPEGEYFPPVTLPD